MMPLDHYYEPNDMYLKSIYLDTTWAWDDAWYSVYYTPGSSIYVSDNLKVGSSTGSTASCAGTYFDESGFWAQTYTQLGIQKAYDMFDAVTDTTVTYHVADDQPDVEITRQPVIIMVTDGDPTLATYEYMNPKGGVTYGVGSTHGILGYYTVLSANYFKNMTSIKYQVKAMFYTIGEGIQDPSEENYGSGSYYQDSVDMYSRTVIDPSSDNITEMTQKVSYWFPYGFTSAGEFMALLINKNYAVAVYDDYTYTTYTTYKVYHGSKALYDTSAEYAYLDSGYLGFEAGGYSSYDYNGYTSYRSRYMRGMDNPYGYTDSSGNFVTDCSYADGAYFGSLNSDDLEQIFEDIIEEVEVSSSYNFLLEENTNIVFTDNIGEGMEVTAAPVLRYFGTNYSNPTVTTNTQQGYVEYTWPTATATRQESDTKWYESSTISLASIKARVTTNSDGTQTVTLTIPESVLPTYYPDLNSQFYYEELPIRLIYKVGLTEESITAMNENTSGGTYTYYVGDYDSASTVYQGATVTFRPESSDPYYTALAQTTAKYNNLAKTTGANTSATSTSYFYETVKTSGEVQQILGNNGVLTITVDETQKTVDIEKVWMDNVDHSNDGVYVVIYAKGTKVPAVVADGETVEPEEVTVALDSVYLTAAEDWRATYTLPTPATRTYREVDNQSVTGYTDYVYTFTNFYAMEEPLTDYIATYKKASTTYTQPSEGTTETPTPVTTYTTLTSTQLTVKNPEVFKEQLHMEIEVPTENVVTIETPYDTHNMSTWFSTESYTQSLFELTADSNGNYNVRIENTPTYTLPETGGIGTQWFTISGTALITAGCFMYIFINRKQRHRGKGGIV
jgi:LPXTG-motif cell wall-anchored protein